ncbi:MAG: hypothetical protein ACRD6N_12700, partial [Pyrinomonadaceae bacterium]
MGQSNRRSHTQIRSEATGRKPAGICRRRAFACLFGDAHSLPQVVLTLVSARIGFPLLLLIAIVFTGSVSSFAGSGMADYEGRLITAIEVVFEGSPPDAAAQAEFLAMLKIAPNAEFSAVRIRDSLQALFDS